jgi:hypothetical protein
VLPHVSPTGTSRTNDTEGIAVEGGTDAAPNTPADVANAQQQLKVAQWLVPALTGAIAVLDCTELACTPRSPVAPHHCTPNCRT